MVSRQAGAGRQQPRLMIDRTRSGEQVQPAWSSITGPGQEHLSRVYKKNLRSWQVGMDPVNDCATSESRDIPSVAEFTRLLPVCENRFRFNRHRDPHVAPNPEPSQCSRCHQKHHSRPTPILPAASWIYYFSRILSSTEERLWYSVAREYIEQECLHTPIIGHLPCCVASLGTCLDGQQLSSRTRVTGTEAYEQGLQLGSVYVRELT